MLRSFVRTFVGEDEEEPKPMATEVTQGSFVDVGTPHATEGHDEHDSDSEHEAQGESETPSTEETALPTPDPEPTCKGKHAKPGHARLTAGVNATEAVEEQTKPETPVEAETVPVGAQAASETPVEAAHVESQAAPETPIEAAHVESQVEQAAPIAAETAQVEAQIEPETPIEAEAAPVQAQVQPETPIVAEAAPIQAHVEAPVEATAPAEAAPVEAPVAPIESTADQVHDLDARQMRIKGRISGTMTEGRFKTQTIDQNEVFKNDILRAIDTRLAAHGPVDADATHRIRIGGENCVDIEAEREEEVGEHGERLSF